MIPRRLATYQGPRATTTTEAPDTHIPPAKVQAVFGEPVMRDGVTVIPVARVRWGVGGSGGEGPEGSGSGGGGGVTAEPVGYMEITAASATLRPMPRSFGPARAVGAAVAAAIVLRALARFRR